MHDVVFSKFDSYLDPQLSLLCPEYPLLGNIRALLKGLWGSWLEPFRLADAAAGLTSETTPREAWDDFAAPVRMTSEFLVRV